MNDRRLEKDHMEAFLQYLHQEEKSAATMEKYLRDVRAFAAYVGANSITKDVVMGYKRHLQEKNYAIRSINSMLASINSFLSYMGWSDCRVKSLKLQKQAYCTEERELSKGEYEQLLNAAEKTNSLDL